MVRIFQLMGQSLSGITRARLRSLLTILGIAISSGALVSMVAFAVGLQTQFEAPINELGLLNDVEVRPAQGAPLLDDAMLRKFHQIPGVVYAYPDFRLSQLEVARGEHVRTMVAVGMPREASLIGVFDNLLVAGGYFTLGAQPQAVLSQRRLEEFAFTSAEDAVGKTLVISASGLAATQPGEFAIRQRQLKVTIVGVYQAPGFLAQFGHSPLLLPADLMREMPGIDFERQLRQLRAGDSVPAAGYTKVTVRAERPSAVFRVEGALRELGFEATAVARRIQEARRAFVFLEALLSAVGTVGLIVAGLGITNTLLMSVMERYQEIGIYKAIGASDRDVGILFLTEAAILGLLGGLAGLALASLVCWLLQEALNLYAAQRGVDELGRAFRFPGWLLAGSVVYAVAISLLSGVYPASRAAKTNPIEALRGR